MAKILRKTQKIFGQNGATDEFAQFGTMKLIENGGTPTYSKDIEVLQNNAAFLLGWQNAVIAGFAPFLEELNALSYILTTQMAYILQNGIPEWDAGTTYYINSIVVGSNSKIYRCKTDDCLNVDPTTDDGTNWYDYELNAANLALSNLTPDGIDFINQSKALETGSISDNIIIYSDIHNYNHSTFDLSKFTINGSPIVTDDGVMYGAGVGNNASFKCGLVDYTQPNFVISCGFIEDDDTSFGRALIGYAVSNYSWGIIINGSIVRGFLSSDGTSWDIGVLTGTTTLVSGHHYVAYLVRENGQKYILYLLDKTTSTLTKEAEITSSADIHNTNQTVANVGRMSGWNSAAPTIDLKEISFNFGSSVINANKTGLDVIKDDNYTVVGSPTISTDGIMSNMSASSYASFTTGITVSKSNQLKIKARITTASSFSKNGRFVGCGTNLFFGHTAAGALSVSFLGTNIPTSISLQPSTMYDCEFIYDGTYLSGSATNVLTGETRTSNKVEVTSANTVTLNGYIGNDTANTNSYLIGSLDLNSIEIYIDGNLIYQPCLKIPYNISKTGSKVVDVYARNRVVSMYEQFGYAPYYTINEANQNFTLPMGEVYGMIQKLSDSTTSMITPDYANGITISGGADYTVPKDGWISYVPVNNTDTSGSVNHIGTGFIAIAGKTVLQCTYASGEDASHADSGFFMIGKGETVFHNMNVGTVYFYPCKGGIN